MPKKRLTPEQIQEIIESKELNTILAKKYDRNAKHIGEIKRKAGVGVGKGGNKSTLTDHDRNAIFNSKEKTIDLVNKYSVSATTINRIRVGFKQPKKEKVIREPRIKVAKPKPAKRIITTITKKKIDKQVTAVKRTAFEVEQEELKKAKKVAADYKQTERQKIESGLWKYVPVGVRGMALREISKL